MIICSVQEGSTLSDANKERKIVLDVCSCNLKKIKPFSIEIQAILSAPSRNTKCQKTTYR